MRVFFATCVLIPFTACAPRYRTEVVGVGNAVVTSRAATSPANVVAPGGVPLPEGSYDLAMRFDIPRAQIIEWRVRCPGVELEGAVGETFDAYRTRRVSELRADRQRMAAVTGVIVGAVAPPVRRETRVVTPAGEAVIRTEVAPGRAASEAVAAAPVEDVILPAWDTGRGTLGAKVHVDTHGAGTCAITAAADDADIRASFQIVRIHDLHLEDAQRKQATLVGAVTARGRVESQLVTYGADRDARQRRLEVEGRARAAAEARAGAEARARAELELRTHDEAYARAEAERGVRAAADARARAEANARAEAEGRARAAAEARAGARARASIEIELRVRTERNARLEVERRVRLEAEAHARWEAEAPARARAELVVRQRTLAYGVRAHVIAWLVTECHADAGRRARLEEQERVAEAESERIRVAHERADAIRIETERAERQRIRIAHEHEVAIRVEAEQAERDRIRIAHEREVAIRLEAERAEQARKATLVAQLEQHRIDDALHVRTQVTGYLVGVGARLRPPRPAPLPEQPGTAPFDGARWTSGHWTWSGQWIWTAGGWSDPSRFGTTGGEVVVEVREPTPVYGVRTEVVPVTEVIRPDIRVIVPVPVRVVPPVVRRPLPPVVRDHRDPPKPQPKADDKAKVRDHRR